MSSSEKDNPKPRLRVVNLAELAASPDVPFVVEGLFRERELVLLSGPSGIGKSLLGVSLSAAIVHGTEFLGRRVVQPEGRVLYIANEGVGGLGKRYRAWAQCKIPDRALWAVEGPVDLLGKDAPLLLETLEEVSPTLIVVDTMSLSMPGVNENDAGAINALVGVARDLIARTGAAFVFVHHFRKAGDVERGSSAIRAAMDTMFEVRDDGAGLTLSCVKARDHALPDPIPFRLESVSWMDSAEQLVQSARVVAQLDRKSSSPVIEARKILVPHLREAPTKGLSRNRLHELTGCHWKTVQGHLEVLQAAGEVLAHDRGDYFSYTLRADLNYRGE